MKRIMAIALAFAFGLSGQVWGAETINILHLDPFSGPFKELGDRHNMGLQFAVDEVNASGGLLGKKVALLKEDSQIKPDVAVRKATKAILQDDAKFIINNISTAIVSALAPVVQEHKIIHFSSATYTASLTGKDFHKYFFRTGYNTEIFSRAFVAYFKTQPWRKFYIINQDFIFGHAVADDFKTAMKREFPDSEIVGEDFHPMATKDFGPYISKIIASKADVVYTGDWGIDLEVLIKQASQMGLKAIFASNQLDEPSVLANIGQAGVGSMAISMYLPTVETKENRAFRDKWHSKYKDSRLPWPANPVGYCYDSVMFFAEAVKKAGSLDPEAIIKAWEGLEYNATCGRYLMRACDHQMLQPLFLSKIEAQSEFFSFPFNGKPVVIPREVAAVPPGETGNPRCK